MFLNLYQLWNVEVMELVQWEFKFIVSSIFHFYEHKTVYHL
jgi:hypothetical protein